MMKAFSIVALLAIFFSACKKSETGPEAPSIELKGLSKNTIRSGDVKDTLLISFSVFDRNADLGNDENSGRFDIFMIDSRATGTPDDTLGFFLPEIPEELKDPSKGLKAEGLVILDGRYVYTRDDHPEGDTLKFNIHVVDRAGNKSNVVTTPDIYITP